jgi:peptidyl-prolyl cis-trans isomerase A (cyclophilin A)
MKKILIAILTAITLGGIAWEVVTIVNTKNQASQAAADSSSATAASVLNAKYTKKQLNKMDLPQLSKAVDPKTETKVVMDTSAGVITFKVFNKLVPLAAENFLTHAKEGYYNGTEFFRVIKDFMFQGGDPDNLGTGGKSIWNGKNTTIDPGTGFKNEITPKLYFIYGAIGMANAGADTNGSQFFVITNKKDSTSQIKSKKSYPDKILSEYKQGGIPSLDGGYTVFGQVIDGFDVLEKIQTQEVEANEQGETSKPKKPYIVNKITVE